MKLASRAIERTGAPVGLLVWRGRHAWVMSGFEATKDLSDGGKVTSVTIYDPLYPFGDGQVAACHYPLERWPMKADEMRRASGSPREPTPA